MNYRNFFKIFISIAVFSAFAPGCSTMSDVLRAKETGDDTSQIYDISNDQAWDLAVHVFRWNGADAIEEHKDQHYMVTDSSHRPFSGAAFMGAWIEPMGEHQVKVTVVTKRKYDLSVTTTLTETGFQSDFTKGVALILAGKSLPISAP